MQETEITFFFRDLEPQHKLPLLSTAPVTKENILVQGAKATGKAILPVHRVAVRFPQARALISRNKIALPSQRVHAYDELPHVLAFEEIGWVERVCSLDTCVTT